MADQQILTSTLVELADTLVDDFDVVDLLTLLTDRCLEAFDVQAAGLMLAAPLGSDLRVMASSSAAMHDLEVFEVQASDGPCIDCYRTGAPCSMWCSATRRSGGRCSRRLRWRLDSVRCRPYQCACVAPPSEPSTCFARPAAPWTTPNCPPHARSPTSRPSPSSSTTPQLTPAT